MDLDKGSRDLAELEEVPSVVSREEPHVELFAVEHGDFITPFSPFYYNEVCERKVLKGSDVPQCEDTPGDRGLCTGIIGWHKGR